LTCSFRTAIALATIIIFSYSEIARNEGTPGLAGRVISSDDLSGAYDLIGRENLSCMEERGMADLSTSIVESFSHSSSLHRKSPLFLKMNHIFGESKQSHLAVWERRNELEF